MKILFAVCLILVSGVHSFGSRRFDPELYEVIIREWVECGKGALKDGIPELELPSFNPLYLKDRHFPIEEFIGGNLEIRNVYLDGLQNFELAQLELIEAPPSLNYEIVVNSTLHGEFEANENSVNREQMDNGKGIFNFNTLLKIKGKVELTEGLEEIQNVELFFDALPKYAIEGITNGGEIAKKWEAWALTINEHQEGINAFLSPYIIKFGNYFLQEAGSPEIATILEYVMRKCP